MIPSRRKTHSLTPTVRRILAAALAVLMLVGLGLALALSAGPVVLRVLGFGAMLLFALLLVWIRFMRASLTVDARSIRFRRHPFLKEETVWTNEIDELRLLPYPEWLEHPLYKKNSQYLPEALRHPLMNGYPALYIRHRRGEVLVNVPAESVPELNALMNEIAAHGR